MGFFYHNLSNFLYSVIRLLAFFSPLDSYESIIRSFLEILSFSMLVKTTYEIGFLWGFRMHVPLQSMIPAYTLELRNTSKDI